MNIFSIRVAIQKVYNTKIFHNINILNNKSDFYESKILKSTKYFLFLISFMLKYIYIYIYFN